MPEVQDQVQVPAQSAAPITAQSRQMGPGNTITPEIEAKISNRNNAAILNSHFTGTQIDTAPLQEMAQAKSDSLPQEPQVVTAPMAIQNNWPMNTVGKTINNDTGQVQEPAVQQQQQVQVAPTQTQAPQVQGQPNTPDVFTKNKNTAPDLGAWGENQKIGDFAKERFDIDNPTTMMNTAQAWRRDASKLKEVEAKYNNNLSGLEALPQDIKDAIRLSYTGGDYRKAFSGNGGINYSVAFENQEKNNIVDHFNPNWEQETRDDAKKVYKDDLTDTVLGELITNKRNSLYNNSRTLFDTNKRQFEDERVRVQEQAGLKLDRFNQSAADSVDTLTTSWPSFGEVEIQELHNILTKEGINSIFLDEKGNYKPDAAERLAWTLYGSKREETTANSAARDATSEANAINMRQGGKQNLNTGSQNPNVVINKEAIIGKQFDHHFSKSPFNHVGRRGK